MRENGDYIENETNGYSFVSRVGVNLTRDQGNSQGLRTTADHFRRQMFTLLSKSALLQRVALVVAEMSTGTKLLVTGAMLLVSAVILGGMRYIIVHVEDMPVAVEESDLSPRARSASVRARSASPSASSSTRGRAVSSSARAPSAEGEGDDGPLCLFYGRIKDHQILASYSLVEKALASRLEDDAINLLKLAKKKNFKAGAKDKLENAKRKCKILYAVDDVGEYMGCLMIQHKFPDIEGHRIIIGLLHVARSHADEAKHSGKDGLSILLSGPMGELFSGHATLSPGGNNQSHAILDKMDNVKMSIRHNVQAAQENDQQLNKLMKSTRGMKSAAHSFGNTSRLAVWKHQLERYKWYIFWGVVISDALVICFVWL